MSTIFSARGAPPPLALARRLRASLGPRALRTILLTIVLVSAALLGGTGAGQAQATATPPDVLAALLVEVRGLRAAMEQMAAAGPRVQLALGRLQLQEQRVNTLVRKLEDIRTNLAQARRELDQFTEGVAQSERVSRESSDPEIRRESEVQLRALKLEAARVTLDVQRLLGEEATLTQDISAEQGRWAEINQRLEELERSLSRR